MATAALDALTREEVEARLAGSPEDRAALIRQGAEAGVAEAQCVLGQMLLDEGRPADAYRWFAAAARQHHRLALNMVGRCFDLGWGVAVDKARAAECYRIAAEAGLDWAMYNYATLLALGDGVVEDKPAALAWFERAAALGNAKAINFVGSFHEDGWVVPQDTAAAARCYAQAATGGDFRAMFNHARMLLSAGRREAALAWLRRCGAAANPPFLAKAAAWLATSSLGKEGVAALEGRLPC